jgi:hypothetical protein
MLTGNYCNQRSALPQVGVLKNVSPVVMMIWNEIIKLSIIFLERVMPQTKADIEL